MTDTRPTPLSRRQVAGMGLAALAAPMLARPALAKLPDPGEVGLPYLERLGRPGRLPDRIAYVPPSRIDPAYRMAIYVNAATTGVTRQKMWVLERGAGSAWRVGLWDKSYWDKKGLGFGRPPYSWPVSTGRHYPGERFAGPTPLGIFNVDDRKSRHRRGWGSPGMYNSIYIDLHYGSGRASGVAIHGTTRGMYRRLGTADSHGCVRITQENSEQLWRKFHPDGKVANDASPLWGTVPRFFKSEPKPSLSATRWNYVRDGSFLWDQSSDPTTPQRLTKEGYRALLIFYRDDVS